MKEVQIEKIIDEKNSKYKLSKVSVVSIRVLVLLLSVINTFFYNYLIDEVFILKQFNKIAVVITGMILVYLVGVLLAFLSNKLYNVFMLNVKETIRLDLIKKIFSDGRNKYNNLNKGEIKNIIEDDVENLEKYYKFRFIEFRLIMLAAIAYLFLMLNTSIFMSIFCLILLPISYFSAQISGVNIEEGAKNYRIKYGEYENYVLESINNWREIKSNNIITLSIDVFLTKWKKMTKIFMRNELVRYLNSFVMSFNRLVLIQSVVYAMGGYLLVKGEISISLLLIFVNYYSLFLGTITQMSNMVPEIKGQKNSVDRVVDLLGNELDEKMYVDIKMSNIEFDDVSYKYPGSSKMVLKNVSFVVEENDFAVVVGKSGSGKSTILKLLLGESDDFEGEIFIGGYEIREISRDSIINKVSIVMQENYFFNRSIKENLLIAKMDATDEELYDVCKRVNLLSYINGLPQKINTIIGENASILSGGQKQRLAIARVLLRNTDIILFDEITSALDFSNERIILDILGELEHTHTIICVTHKDIIKEKSAKQILIEEGRVAL